MNSVQETDVFDQARDANHSEKPSGFFRNDLVNFGETVTFQQNLCETFANN